MRSTLDALLPLQLLTKRHVSVRASKIACTCVCVACAALLMRCCHSSCYESVSARASNIACICICVANVNRPLRPDQQKGFYVCLGFLDNRHSHNKMFHSTEMKQCHPEVNLVDQQFRYEYLNSAESIPSANISPGIFWIFII